MLRLEPLWRVHDQSASGVLHLLMKSYFKAGSPRIVLCPLSDAECHLDVVFDPTLFVALRKAAEVFGLRYPEPLVHSILCQFAPPAVVEYDDHSIGGEYWKHFERVYCPQPVQAKNGMVVPFFPDDADHALTEEHYTNRNDFSLDRARRVDWIKAGLESPLTEFHHKVEWKGSRLVISNENRVVCLAFGMYVVALNFIGDDEQPTAKFVTAYALNSEQAYRISQNPAWHYSKKKTTD